MAQKKSTSERESGFCHPVPVKDGTENGRQLDEVQLNERRNKSVGTDDDSSSSKTRNDAHSSELSEVENVVPNEQPFTSRSELSNEYDEFAEQETLPPDGYIEKEDESGSGEIHRFVRLGSGTMKKAYPKGTEIVGIRCGICFKKTQKPKLIGDKKNVVVYETLKQNYS